MKQEMKKRAKQFVLQKAIQMAKNNQWVTGFSKEAQAMNELIARIQFRLGQ